MIQRLQGRKPDKWQPCSFFKRNVCRLFGDGFGSYCNKFCKRADCFFAHERANLSPSVHVSGSSAFLLEWIAKNPPIDAAFLKVFIPYSFGARSTTLSLTHFAQLIAKSGRLPPSAGYGRQVSLVTNDMYVFRNSVQSIRFH